MRGAPGIGPTVLPYPAVPAIRPAAPLAPKPGGPGSAWLLTGPIVGGCMNTRACSKLPTGAWWAEGSTLPALANRCCGTTVAKRRLANCAFMIFAGGRPPRGNAIASMFATLARLSART